MSTIEMEVAAPTLAERIDALTPDPRPSKSAIDLYRQSVYEGEYDPDVCFAASRIMREWQADRRTFEARQAAAKTLSDSLPKLQEAVRQADQAARAAQQAWPDTVTLADLRQALQSAAPGFIPKSRYEWMQAMGALASHVETLKSAALQASFAAEEREGTSRASLAPNQSRERGRGHPPHRRENLRHRGTAWSSGGPRLRPGSSLRNSGIFGEALAAGTVAPPTQKYDTTSQRAGRLKRAYLSARRKLDALIELAGGTVDAQAAQARDEAELAALHHQSAEARKSAIEKRCGRKT